MIIFSFIIWLWDVFVKLSCLISIAFKNIDSRGKKLKSNFKVRLSSVQRLNYSRHDAKLFCFGSQLYSFSFEFSLKLLELFAFDKFLEVLIEVFVGHSLNACNAKCFVTSGLHECLSPITTMLAYMDWLNSNDFGLAEVQWRFLLDRRNLRVCLQLVYWRTDYRRRGRLIELL